MLKNGVDKTTEIEEMLEQNFVELDRSRIAELKSLLAIRRVKIKQLGQEAARLEKKHGKDDPKTKNAAEKKAFSEDFAAELRREIVHAETPTPKAADNVWLAHGFVADEKGKPVSGVIVRLFDEKGKVIRTDREAKSDEKGYYSLEVDNPERLPETVRIGVTPSGLSEKILSPVGGQADSAMITIGDNKNFGTLIPELKLLSGWMVTGKILDAAGNGVAGLKAQIFAKDLLRDEALDETTTDAKGVYSATFSTKKISDIRPDEYPELYLIIKDAAGNKLFDGQQAARNSAGKIELADIKLEENSAKNEKKYARQGRKKEK